MEFLKYIEKLPVPTILVIAGIVFLFIALGGQFGAKIVTDKIRPKYSGILGIFLLLIGIVIYTPPPNINNGGNGGDGNRQLRIEALQKDIENINKHKRKIETIVGELSKHREPNGELNPEAKREIDKFDRELGEIEKQLKKNQMELKRLRSQM